MNVNFDEICFTILDASTTNSYFESKVLIQNYVFLSSVFFILLQTFIVWTEANESEIFQG